MQIIYCIVSYRILYRSFTNISV